MSDELTWRKSSYSGGTGEACVEIAATPSAIHVRDSKDLVTGTQPSLTFAATPWAIFIGDIAAGGTGA
jgi:hypothetical protein